MKPQIDSLRRLIKFFSLVAMTCAVSSCKEGALKSADLRGGGEEGSEKVEEIFTLLSWDDYFPSDVLEAFALKEGVEVRYETYSDSDELEARLRSEPGGFDVVVADDVSLGELIELRLVQEIDAELVPSIANIDPDFLDLSFDLKNRYSIPYLWGTWVVAYRKDILPEPPKTWDVLWNQRLEGKVMMMNESFDPIWVTLMMLGISPNTDDPAAYAQAEKKLVEQIEQRGARYGSYQEVKEGLLDGSIWGAMYYSGDAARVAEENDKIDFFVPEEGAPIWIDNFAVARDSGNVQLAHAFIEFMQQPENAAANANYAWTASPNVVAKPQIDEALVSDERIWPGMGVRQKSEVLTVPDAVRAKLIKRAWHSTRMALAGRGEDPLPETSVEPVVEASNLK